MLFMLVLWLLLFVPFAIVVFLHNDVDDENADAEEAKAGGMDGNGIIIDEDDDDNESCPRGT